MKCPVVSFEVSMGFLCLLAACIFVLCQGQVMCYVLYQGYVRVMFLLCWRISLVCLALKLVCSWVALGFSVGMQAFECAFGVGDGQGGLACCIAKSCT